MAYDPYKVNPNDPAQNSAVQTSPFTDSGNPWARGRPDVLHPGQFGSQPVNASDGQLNKPIFTGQPASQQPASAPLPSPSTTVNHHHYYGAPPVGATSQIPTGTDNIQIDSTTGLDQFGRPASNGPANPAQVNATPTGPAPTPMVTPNGQVPPGQPYNPVPTPQTATQPTPQPVQAGGTATGAFAGMNPHDAFMAAVKALGIDPAHARDHLSQITDYLNTNGMTGWAAADGKAGDYVSFNGQGFDVLPAGDANWQWMNDNGTSDPSSAFQPNPGLMGMQNSLIARLLGSGGPMTPQVIAGLNEANKETINNSTGAALKQYDQNAAGRGVFNGGTAEATRMKLMDNAMKAQTAGQRDVGTGAATTNFASLINALTGSQNVLGARDALGYNYNNANASLEQQFIDAINRASGGV